MEQKEILEVCSAMKCHFFHDVEKDHYTFTFIEKLEMNSETFDAESKMDKQKLVTLVTEYMEMATQEIKDCLEKDAQLPNSEG